MNIIKNQKWNCSVIAMSLILFLASILHRLQFNHSKQVYVGSFLIHVEMISLIVILLMNLINGGLIIKYLFLRKWKKLLITAGVFVCSLVLMCVSMHIDAPTMIYMTRIEGNVFIC